MLNINIDGAGYFEGNSAFSLFNLPDNQTNTLQKILQEHEDIEEGIKWVQGDHSIFVQFGRPAIAVSSKWFIENIDTQAITQLPRTTFQL